MISNSSPLIVFARINNIHFLTQLYDTLAISPSVHNETITRGLELQLPDALILEEQFLNKKIIVKDLDDVFTVTARKIQHIYSLDIVESDSIALALQLKNSCALIDDKPARTAALSLGIKPIGSLGVLSQLFRKGLLSEEELRRTVTKMIESGFRMNTEVVMEFFNLVEEIKKRKR